MRLTCSVEGPNSPRFSIIWFRRVTSGDEQLTNSQSGVNIVEEASSLAGGNEQFIRRSSLMLLTGLNQADDIGDYWCQVRLNNGSIFQERSNMLTLNTEAVYLAFNFSRCTGSQVIGKVNCLTLQTMAPTVTDNGAPSNSGSTPQTTVISSFFDYTSTYQTTGSFIEKYENRLTTLYAIIIVIVVFAVMILVFGVAICLIRWKQKHIARYNEDEGHHEQQETRFPIEHQPLEAETTATSEHAREVFDFKENVAYDTVAKVTLTENVSYETTMPPRAASPLEVKDDGRHEQQETKSTTEHQPLEAETTAASEHAREVFHFKENEAYNSSPVDKITLTENVSYETTMPPRAASPLEAEYEEIDEY